jgi:hypothetical protein
MPTPDGFAPVTADDCAAEDPLALLVVLRQGGDPLTWARLGVRVEGLELHRPVAVIDIGPRVQEDVAPDLRGGDGCLGR